MQEFVPYDCEYTADNGKQYPCSKPLNENTITVRRHEDRCDIEVTIRGLTDVWVGKRYANAFTQQVADIIDDDKIRYSKIYKHTVAIRNAIGRVAREYNAGVYETCDIKVDYDPVNIKYNVVVVLFAGAKLNSISSTEYKWYRDRHVLPPKFKPGDMVTIPKGAMIVTLSYGIMTANRDIKGVIIEDYPGLCHVDVAGVCTPTIDFRVNVKSNDLVREMKSPIPDDAPGPYVHTDEWPEWYKDSDYRNRYIYVYDYTKLDDLRTPRVEDNVELNGDKWLDRHTGILYDNNHRRNTDISLPNGLRGKVLGLIDLWHYVKFEDGTECLARGYNFNIVELEIHKDEIPSWFAILRSIFRRKNTTQGENK